MARVASRKSASQLPSSTLDFDQLVQRLDPNPETIPNPWKLAYDHLAKVVLLCQLDVRSAVPRIKRAVRIECRSSRNSGLSDSSRSATEEGPVPRVFIGERAKGSEYVYDMLGRETLGTFRDLTALLEQVGAEPIEEGFTSNLSVAIPVYERSDDSGLPADHEKSAAGSNFLDAFPLFGSSGPSRPLPGQSDDEEEADFSIASHCDASPSSEFEVDLPLVKDDDNDSFVHDGSPEIPSPPSVKSPVLKRTVSPKKKKRSSKRTPQGVRDESAEDSRHPAVAKEDSSTSSNAAEYWRTKCDSGPTQIALQAGSPVFVYENVLQDLQRNYGPANQSSWRTYASQLALHLLGGKAAAQQTKRASGPRCGITNLLGKEALAAITGHVNDVFGLPVPLDCRLVTYVLNACVNGLGRRKKDYSKLSGLARPTRESTGNTEDDDVEAADQLSDASLLSESDADRSMDGEGGSAETSESGAPRRKRKGFGKSQTNKRTRTQTARKNRSDEVAESNHTATENNSSSTNATAYWREKCDSGPTQVALRPGYPVFVYETVLQDLQHMHGPSKHTRWTWYGWHLALHLLGGKETARRTKRAAEHGCGITDLLGYPTLIAIAGHVTDVYELPEQLEVRKLTELLNARLYEFKKRPKNVATSSGSAGLGPGLPENSDDEDSADHLPASDCATAYWRAKQDLGPPQKPIRDGYPVFVYESVLEDLLNRHGPGKHVYCTIYGWHLVLHLLGGPEAAQRAKRAVGHRCGIMDLLGSQTMMAIAGHLTDVFELPEPVDGRKLLSSLNGRLGTFAYK